MFDIDFVEKGKLLLHIRKFLLSPQYWIDKSNQIPISLTWQKCKFTPQNRNQVPKEKGIYCFVVCPEYANFFETKYLFYVGKTNRTLWERYKEYLDDQQGKGKPRPKVYEMLKLYKDCLMFYFAEIKTSSDVNLCEDRLINTFVPHINTQIPDAKIKSELKYIYES